MARYLWRVTATRKVTPTIASGMWVEIVLNINRKPMQKEIKEALNAKYGENTVVGTLPLAYFEIKQL